MVVGRGRSGYREATHRPVGTGPVTTMTTSNTRPINPGLSDLWMPLLRELTDRYPSWVVWKNPESAFSGPGDIDSLAPPAQWDAIQRTFREWAIENEFRPIVVCRHVPQGPHFIAVDPSWPHMLILDVKEVSTWRGSTLVDYRGLEGATYIEERGFRRMRPGVEGVVKLMLNGVLVGGRPNTESLEIKGVDGLLRSDPEGVDLAASWFGPMSGAVRSGVAAYLEGGWDRRSMLQVELMAGLKSFTEPRTAISRLLFKHYTIKRCLILQSIRKDNRRIPDDSAAWYRQVALNHEIDLIPQV